MPFFGSNPEPALPGGPIDYIIHFRYDLDPNIDMKAGKTRHYLSAASFASRDCNIMFSVILTSTFLPLLTHAFSSKKYKIVVR